MPSPTKKTFLANEKILARKVFLLFFYGYEGQLFGGFFCIKFFSRKLRYSQLHVIISLKKAVLIWQ